MSRWGKHIGGRKDHVKYAYLLRSKPSTKYSKNSEIPKYLFAYLTDENKVFFDEFHVKEQNYFMRSTVRQFIRKITSRNIDSNTQIYYYFGEGRYHVTDLIFLLWSFYHRGVQFNMTKVNPAVSAKRISRFFNLHMANYRRDPRKVGFGESMKVLYEMYDVILKNKVCPWITDEFNQRIELIKPSRRRMYKIVTMGLLHMVVKDIDMKKV